VERQQWVSAIFHPISPTSANNNLEDCTIILCAVTSIILATWEAEVRRIKVQGQSRQMIHETCPLPPISKITRAKWTGGVAQVVEHLLCTREDLNSKNSSPIKNIFKKNVL
jgi:hypothetical protein